MKTSSFSLPCLVLALLLSTGCESNGIANRISEKSAVFTTLSSAEKQNLEDGMIFPGYTTDMAYIALGKPSSVETKQKNDTTIEMWTYRRFYPSGKLAAVLTEYSRARNPNLNRSLNVNIGAAHVSDHAPGSNPGRNSGIGAGTGTATGEDPGLSLPDIPVYNLYVFFHEGKVVDIKLDSLDGTKL